MASSSSSSATTNPFFGFQISEKLTKNNHALWAAQILTVSRLKGHVTGKSEPPPAEIDHKEGENTTRIVNPARDAWFVQDQQVLGFVFSSLSREILTQVAAAKTAAEASQEIQQMFASRTRARSLNVRLALTTTKKGNMSVSDYYSKMRFLGDELAASGKPLDDEDLGAYILNGLDDDFEPVVSALVARVEPLSLAELYSQLLSFENRQALQHAGQASANAANRGGRGGNPSSRGGFGRGRSNRGRGGGERGRGGDKQRQNSNDSRPICQVCFKRGHVAADCWHRFDQDYMPDEKHIAAAATDAHAYGVDTNWYIDTGATDHLTNELDKLSVREQYKGNDRIHTAGDAGSCHEEHNS